MRAHRLFRATRFSFFALFAAIILSVSVLSITTISREIRDEYVQSSTGIAKNIADSSVDILLNRNLATLQSLIDQFVEIETVRYIYVTSDTGEYLAHTFVPGVPTEIRASDPYDLETVERNLPGLGNFIEVASPILAGAAGTVHVGMDLELIEVKIQRAVGRQMYLFGIMLVVGTLLSTWFVSFTARPLRDLMDFATRIVVGEATDREAVLARLDEAGDLARIMLLLGIRAGSVKRVEAEDGEAPAKGAAGSQEA